MATRVGERTAAAALARTGRGYPDLHDHLKALDGARVGLTHCTGGGISGFDHGVCSIHLFAR